MSLMGYASGHRVNLSMAVRQYLKSEEIGNGPTMSRWIWVNLDEGGRNVEIEEEV